eukprot:Opistho-2@38180
MAACAPALRVLRLTESAKLPTRATPASAGYDLYSAADLSIPPKGKALVPTDITIGLPDGCYGRIAPRSSLAWKNFVDVGAGVIDADYRGAVGVVLYNFSDIAFEVKKGDRVAQLILERIFTPEVKEVSTLEETERGAGGYGSTGTR